MTLALTLLFFVLGMVVGSFLNVIIYRYHMYAGLGGRSMCFSCGKQLSWYELIPVFSYLFLRGKCGACKSAISIQYLLVEMLTGVLFAGIAFKGFVGMAAFIPLVVVSILVVILVYDIHHKIIPDAMVYIFIMLSFVQMFITFDALGVTSPSGLDLFAGPLLFLPFFAIWYFTQGTWMGLGDGKLVLGIGWFLGFQAGITAVVFGFWIGAIIGLLVLFIEHVKQRHKKSFGDKVTLKSEIPFAPFLIAGFLGTFYFELNLLTFIL